MAHVHTFARASLLIIALPRGGISMNGWFPAAQSIVVTRRGGPAHSLAPQPATWRLQSPIWRSAGLTTTPPADCAHYLAGELIQ